MPRSLWTGSLSFGLVNVPIALYSAVRDQDIHFHQLHEKDGARIETRRFCAKEGKEVAYEDIGRGFELDSGKQVVLTDEELDAVAPRRTRTIEIEAFVAAAEIDPMLYDHPYWLVPTGDSEGPRRAYRGTPRSSTPPGSRAAVCGSCPASFRRTRRCAPHRAPTCPSASPGR